MTESTVGPMKGPRPPRREALLQEPHGRDECGQPFLTRGQSEACSLGRQFLPSLIFLALWVERASLC